MFERITPNPGTSYAQNLIEYTGIVYFDSNGHQQFAGSPGVSLTQAGTGPNFYWQVTCLDYLPIYSKILNQPYQTVVPGTGLVNTQNLSAIDAGFSSTLTCQAALIVSTTTPNTNNTNIVVSVPQLNAAGQVFFNIKTIVAAALVQAPFTFRIVVTGQLEQQIPGLGS